MGGDLDFWLILRAGNPQCVSVVSDTLASDVAWSGERGALWCFFISNTGNVIARVSLYTQYRAVLLREISGNSDVQYDAFICPRVEIFYKHLFLHVAQSISVVIIRALLLCGAQKNTLS